MTKDETKSGFLNLPDFLGLVKDKLLPGVPLHLVKISSNSKNHVFTNESIISLSGQSHVSSLIKTSGELVFLKNLLKVSSNMQ